MFWSAVVFCRFFIGAARQLDRQVSIHESPFTPHCLATAAAPALDEAWAAGSTLVSESAAEWQSVLC